MSQVFEYPNTYVERVVDGDTIDVTFRVDVGFKIIVQQSIRVRLADIDTAEIYGVKKGTAEYREGKSAAERVKQLVEGKTVLMKTRKTRKGDERKTFGRYVADIWFRASSDVEYNLAELLRQEGFSK